MIKSKTLYSQGYDDAMMYDNSVKIYSNDPSYQQGYADGIKFLKKNGMHS